MSHLTAVADGTATLDEIEALREIRAAWGAVPTLGRVMARSLPLTRGFLAFGGSLKGGRFGGARAEQIAIAVANENRCRYCLAAHTAAGRALGLDGKTLADARVGQAADQRMSAALTFAQTVVRTRGHVRLHDLALVRAAGWSDGDVVELVGHVMATTLTNYLHHLSQVPLDAPTVPFAEAIDAKDAA